MTENREERGLEARRSFYRSVLENQTLMSDFLMNNVLKERKCTEYILQVIMGIEDLQVLEQVLQMDFKNLQGRSAILDCVARDQRGKLYNVEIQQKSEGASPKRARYHAGLMDMNVLERGQDFDRLPECHVIFITEKDTLGYGQPIYHIERRIRENGEYFRDESHIVYVNSSSQEETELGRLMHDFHCKSASEMYSEVLSGRVRTLKETEEGIEEMCRELEELYQMGMMDGRTEGRNEGIALGRAEGRNEGIALGRAEGRSEGIALGRAEGRAEGRTEGRAEGERMAKKEMVFSLAEIELPVERIAELVKVSVQQVQEWLTGKADIAR